MTGKLFFGGVPTDADVKALREAYPDGSLTDGREISHEEIERLIEVRRNTSRYRAVTNRWRKLVENDTGRIVIVALRGVGFRVAPNGTKVSLSEDQLRQAGRKARRASILTARVDVSGLSEEERSRLLHVQRLSASILASAQLKSKENNLPSIGAAQ